MISLAGSAIGIPLLCVDFSLVRATTGASDRPCGKSSGDLGGVLDKGWRNDRKSYHESRFYRSLFLRKKQVLTAISTGISGVSR
jgi:hypothetical protein